MDLMKRLFGGAANPDPVAASQLPVGSETKAREADALVATRRELLRVLSRNTQRLAGIPEGWIESQVHLEMVRGQTFLHLSLVIRRWDERLLKYSLAFQRQLMAEVARFEPDAREWLVRVSWEYASDLECPCPDLPDPSVWTRRTEGAPVDVMIPIEPDEVESDIARLYAVAGAAPRRSGSAQDDSTH